MVALVVALSLLEAGSRGPRPCAVCQQSDPSQRPSKGSGSITIDGSTTTLAHVVKTARKNPFNDFFTDVVVILSDTPLTEKEAADDEALFARASRGELVTMAL